MNLMNGVKVLNWVLADNKNEITTIIIFGILSIFFAICFIICACKRSTPLIDRVVAFVLGLVLLIFSVTTLNSGLKRKVIPHKEYKVTIDKSVKYIEFTNKYKVINQKGSVYTIKLKDKN